MFRDRAPFLTSREPLFGTSAHQALLSPAACPGFPRAEARGFIAGVRSEKDAVDRKPAIETAKLENVFPCLDVDRFLAADPLPGVERGGRSLAAFLQG